MGTAPTVQASSDRIPSLSWPLAPLHWEAPADPDRFIEALGEEAGCWGSLKAGLEGWAYPFKLFEELELCLQQGKEKAARQSWRTVARWQIATPYHACLELHFDGVPVKARIFVPRKGAGLWVGLECSATRDLQAIVRFRPRLIPMHLDQAGPLSWEWDAPQQRLIVREPTRQVELQVATPKGAAHRVLSDGRHELSVPFAPVGTNGSLAFVAFGVSWPQGPSAETILGRLLEDPQRLIDDSIQSYRAWLDRAPHVQSPEREVDEALAWAAVSLAQLRVHNPDLGYGLVSGYSSSGRGTRPRYCWFFEEPTLTSWAYHRVGQSDLVKESLRFLQRFQREDGKTVHEVTQSLRYWPDFLKRSRYAYMHTDGPVYFLTAYGQYLRATGDLAFIREEWPRIRRTLAWCLSVTDRSDGLICIQPGEWGSSESSVTVWKDTQLEAMWVRALRECARMARLLDEPALAEECAQLADQARASIEAKLWDATAGNYVWGLDRRGQPLRSQVPHHAIGFWLSELDPRRVDRALELMAGAEFRTDWGIRSLSLADARHDPASYQTGSVWPVWNAGVIISDFQHRRGVDAFRNWHAMVEARRLAALGPMPEVLDGRVFRKLPEGVPHQMFSELAVVNGFFEGLLGLEVDLAEVPRVRLAPQPPPHWPRLRIDRIPVGPGRLDLDLEQSQSLWTCRLDLHGLPAVELDLVAVLPAGAKVERVRWDDRPVEISVRASSRATEVRLLRSNVRGTHRLEIRHRGGVSFLPQDLPLTPGVTNRNLRIVQTEWRAANSTWTWTLEGLPGHVYPVRLFTDRNVPKLRGGQVSSKEQDGYLLRLAAPTEAPHNAAGYARWTVELQFPRE